MVVTNAVSRSPSWPVTRNSAPGWSSRPASAWRQHEPRVLRLPRLVFDGWIASRTLTRHWSVNELRLRYLETRCDDEDRYGPRSLACNYPGTWTSGDGDFDAEAVLAEIAAPFPGEATDPDNALIASSGRDGETAWIIIHAPHSAVARYTGVLMEVALSHGLMLWDPQRGAVSVARTV